MFLRYFRLLFIETDVGLGVGERGWFSTSPVLEFSSLLSFIFIKVLVFRN